LIGRGLRVDKESEIPPRQQVCRIIGPDDKGFKDFIDYLRGEQDLAIPPPRDADGEPPDNPNQCVEYAQPTSSRVEGLDPITNLSPAELAYAERLRTTYGVFGPLTHFARWLDDNKPDWRSGATADKDSGFKRDDVSGGNASDTRTEREQVADLKSDAKDDVLKAAYSYGIIPNGNKQEYQDKLKRFWCDYVLDPFGISSTKQITGIEQARRYRGHCQELKRRMERR
jgi:hypothetical protein